MYTAKLEFQILRSPIDDEQSHALYSLLGALRMNGQIVGREFPLAQVDNAIHSFILILRPDALSPTHHNHYVHQALANLDPAGLSHPQLTILGPDPTATNTPCDRCASPNRPDHYILHTHYLAIGSPLKCGHCFCDIPLYTISPMRDHEYNDLISWQSDYRACDQLQMNCAIGERFGTRELSMVTSSLSQRGRSLAQQIEAATATPTYYYLYHYRPNASRKQEESRPCPSCKGEWHLAKRWHRFDFRCDRCRLVSSVHPN